MVAQSCEAGSNGVSTPWLTRPIGVIAFAIFPLSIVAYRGMAPLFVLAALVAASTWYSDRTTARLRLDPASLAIALFIILAAVSLSWAPSPIESLRTLLPVAATLLAGLILVRFARSLKKPSYRAVTIGVIAGGVLGYGLFAFELVSGYVLTREFITFRDIEVNQLTIANMLKPGGTVAALFLWPWTLALSRILPQWATSSAAAAAAAVVIIIGSHSVVIATATGAAFAVVGLTSRRAVHFTLGLSLACLIMTGPWLVQHVLPDPTQPGSDLENVPRSAVHRIAIWHTTADLISLAPWLGHGFDSSRSVSGPETVRELIFLPDVPEHYFRILSEPIPLHPHSLFLQTWLENGAVGAALLSMVLMVLVGNASRTAKGRIERACAFGALGATIMIAAISFGAWQSWWMGTIFLICMITAASQRSSPTPGAPIENRYIGK